MIKEAGQELLLVVNGRIVFRTTSVERMWGRCVEFQLSTGKRVANLEEMCG